MTPAGHAPHGPRARSRRVPRAGAPTEEGTRRAGFTLVEVLVAAGVSTVLIASAILVYNLSNRSRGVTASARALQTAMLIEERMTEDLLRLVLARPVPLHWSPDKDPSRLSFYAYDPTGPKGPPLPYRGVVYSLDKPGEHCRRECGGQTESVGVLPLKSLVFRPFLSPTGPMIRVTLEVARDPSDPPGPAICHSFLARLVAPIHHMVVDKPISAFLDPRDVPTQQMLTPP